jgi:hypothetical protein
VTKAWYNFFVVTEGQQGDAAAVSTDATNAATNDATTNPGNDPTRVADLAATGADPSFTDAVTNLAPLAEIYTSAQISVPSHGYTVLKVADMLHSEHIRALPTDVKRKSILVALEAAGVSVDEIVQDALHRDRALDTYERVLQKSLDDFRSEKLAENARLEQEIAERLAELRGRIEANNQGVFTEMENLQAWQSRKQDEERRIAEAVGYFVTENPITTTATAPAADVKGDANAR